MSRVRVPDRPVPAVRDTGTVYYDDDVLLTSTEAWTAVTVPLKPFGFRSYQDRFDLGWASSLSLGALKDGDLRVKVSRVPFTPDAWRTGTAARAGDTGTPTASFGGHLAACAGAMGRRQSTTKQVTFLRKLGDRSVVAQAGSWAAKSDPFKKVTGRELPPVTAREVARWTREAGTVRDVLARGGFAAEPLDADGLRALRRHAITRGLTAPRPSFTGRRTWGPGEIVDEFADVELTPTGRGVRVDSPTGTVFTATLVMAVFPQEVAFPDSPPWLAHLDRVGQWAEADLILRLFPPRKAAAHVLKRLRLAQDQRADAANAGTDLPIETARMVELARELQFTLPSGRLPYIAGWGRIHVDAGSEEELATRVQRTIEVYSDERSPHIDLHLPTGMAQVDLLLEGIPGFPVAHKSWRQRWTVQTVACSLPHAGSELGHRTGLYAGWTTGRTVKSVALDFHASITRQVGDDRHVEGPGGAVFLGAQRSGKSSAFGRIIDHATQAGLTTVAIDFSGPLGRLATLPRYEGRCRELNLLKVGGGVLDTMTDAVIPGNAQTNLGVRHARMHLTRDTLSLVAFKLLEGKDGAEMGAELLRAIQEVATTKHPSTREVIDRLGRTRGTAAGQLAEHLRFEFDTGEGAQAMVGEGERVAVTDDPLTRIITAPGLMLPEAGTHVRDWQPSEAMASALFGVAAHLARRLMWELPPDQLKFLLVDEAHIALGTDAGRRVIVSSLRDGPKHGVSVMLATHNAKDIDDEVIVNALASKFQFRSTSDTELERGFRITGLEDTPANRKQVRTLKNGECVAVMVDGTADRLQWDLEYDPELKAVLRTTPTGVAL